MTEQQQREGKPLHVRVAEALGTLKASHDWDEYDCMNCGLPCHWSDEDHAEAAKVPCAPRYDTDWAATGPLIEEFKLDISPTCAGDWEAGAFVSDEAGYLDSRAAIPLEAVCNLILKLKEAGRL